MSANSVKKSQEKRPLMTVRQAAEKWGVSIRRVSKLCQDGRVEGAYKPSSRMWLIPVDAEKPKTCRGRPRANGGWVKGGE